MYRLHISSWWDAPARTTWFVPADEKSHEARSASPGRILHTEMLPC